MVRSCALPLVFAGHAFASQQAATASANPIRKVVNMLDNMVKKVEADGAREEKLFTQFMCYCKNGRGSLEESISGAETKVPQVSSAIEETAAEIKQLAADLAAAQQDRSDAKSSVQQATALRNKEAAEYAKVSGDFKTNIAAMGKAIGALEKGASGSFLQSSVVPFLQKVSIKADLATGDRDVLSAFLSAKAGDAYAPQSGEVTGILKQMKDTMEADLAAATSAEDASIKAFEAMSAAKAKEIQALTEAIETKTIRHGEAKVELVNLKADLSDTQAALLEDKKFLAELDKGCATKEAEWAERQKTRAEEVLALHETIKVLNDDDALELFKKTLPGSSFLELKVGAKEAAAVLAKGGHDVRVNLIALALKGQKVDMGKVVAMIDEMTALLAEEQVSDDAKKQYCETELDVTEDKIKGLELKASDLEKAAADANSKVETLTSEIKALGEGIAALDKSVAAATEQRKEENTEYVSTLAANKAAVDLLGFAKNRLNKFYNPKLYKAAPKRELSTEDRIAVGLGGGTPPPTEAPGGIAGTGISAFAEVKADPGPAPSTWEGGYKKKGEESSGVIAMIDMIVADVDKEIQEMQVEEKNAQQEYETLLSDSAAKRATDTKASKEKEGAKADLEASLLKLSEKTASTKKAALLKIETLGGLHKECDWLLGNYDARKEARAGEVESLKKAKAVLSGADYALLQVQAPVLAQVSKH